MRLGKLAGLALLCICITPLSATAGDFDGSKPLLCASMRIVECVATGKCQEVPATSVDAPKFLKIDFNKKMISAARQGANKKTSEIKHMDRIDGKIMLLGVEDGVEGVRDGLGWTMAISEDSGDMVLTGSGDQVGFVIFGACTPL
jgi:hypothetical protein